MKTVETNSVEFNHEMLPDLSVLRLGDNAAALALLNEWMADESGYDERVWPIVKELIEENRLSERKRFAD